MKYNLENFQPDLGQSGDNVRLIELSGNLFVEKSSNNPKPRLEIQAKKQANFYSSSGIQAPKIVSDWNGVSFLMEYVPGLPLGEFLKSASVEETKKVIKVISNYFMESFENSKLNSSMLGENVTFVNKLSDVFNATTKKVSVDFSTHLEQFIKLAKLVPDRTGPNHGDFSFENLLIGKNASKMWILDFLDSPIENPMLDVGRFLLDCEHGWWKSGTSPNASEILALSQLSTTTRKACREFESLDIEISLFKVFASLRIFPYTQNPTRKAILMNCIEREIQFWIG